MKRLLFALIVVFSLATSIVAQEMKYDVLAERAVSLSKLWSEIKYNFVNIDRIEFDVDSLYFATMQRALSVNNNIDYYKELASFLRHFNDAHTDLFIIPDGAEEDIDYPCYSTKRIGDKYYFTAYRLGRKDVDKRLLGAEIIEVMGIPTQDYVEKMVLPEVTGSTRNYRLNMAGMFLLNGKRNTYITGKALTTTGELIDFNIIRDGEATRTDEDKYCPDFIVNRENISLTWVNRIALLKIRSFYSTEVCSEIDRKMDEIRSNSPKGLILDLRGNNGGETEVAHHLQMYLTKGDTIKSFAAQTRDNLGYGRAQGNYDDKYKAYFDFLSYKTFPVENISRKEYVEPLECPIVILIDNMTFSACEDLLINIVELPERPLLIGEETAGSTGAPLVVHLPYGAVARICTLRPLFPYSLIPFSGMGIKPDIEVIPTIEECIKGIDVVLNKAIEVLETNFTN